MDMLFIIFVVLVTASLPLIMKHGRPIISDRKLKPAPAWLPVLAAILFWAAFYIPNIHISEETTTFQQHFTGGGIYCACLFIYFKNLFGWRFDWWLMLVLLFAWVSAFGVANELLEFTLTKSQLARINTGDTDWDLLANTLGALVGYCVLKVLRVDRRSD